MKALIGWLVKTKIWSLSDSSTDAFPNRASQWNVFNNGQKMALRAFYFIRTLTKALTYYYIKCSQRHLLAAFEDKRLFSPIDSEFQSISYFRL